MTADQIIMNALSSTALLDLVKPEDETAAAAEMIAEIIDCTVRSFPEGEADTEELTEKMVRRIRLILPEHGFEETVTEQIAEEARLAVVQITGIADAAIEETAEDPSGEDEGTEESTEFELRYGEMLDKLSVKYPDAAFFGQIIGQHSCLEEQYCTDDEALEIIRDFILQASETFDRTNYETEVLSIRKCFDSVLGCRNCPAARLVDGEQEIVTDLCLTRIAFSEELAEEEAEQGLHDPAETVYVGSDDIKTLDMAYVFATVPYDVRDVDFLRNLGINYDYEHNHMSTWFAAQITRGKGHYFRVAPNLSARYAYNHLTNPRSLLWIATVMDIHEDLILRACREMQTGRTSSGKCGIIRRFIPFDMILCQARERLAELAE